MKAWFLLIGLFILSVKTVNGESRLVCTLYSDAANTLLHSNESRPTVYFQSDTILDHIQQKIEQAMEVDINMKDAKALSALERKLEQVKNNELASYWMAYIQYSKTKAVLAEKNHKAAKQADEKGIKILEEKTFKNADDYALLVLLKGLSFYFAPESEAMRIYMDIES